MDKKVTSLIEGRESLRKRGADPKRSEALIHSHGVKPDNTDPIAHIDIPDARQRIKEPPGELATMCNIIAEHFEKRKDGHMFRLAGAIGVAQVIIGNKLKTPTGSKMMFQVITVAKSGSGKSAPMEFVGEAAIALGVPERYRSSTVTSTKQLMMHTIEAGGAMVYNIDDNKNHLVSWDNDRSPMGETSGFIRSQSSTSIPWEVTAPIQRDISAALSDAMNLKLITARSKAEGWLVPRTGDGDESQVDYVRLAQMPHSTGINLGKAMRTAELASKPIDDFKIVPMVSLTPDMAQSIVTNWRANGSMGRSLFLYYAGDVPDFKDDFPKPWNPSKFVNMWKPRIPGITEKAVWASGAEAVHKSLSRRMDSIRNEEGIVGIIATRYSQLMTDLATMCAFFDVSARKGKSIEVGVSHLEWAYITCIDSMKAMREYMEGEEETDGLAQTEWGNIVARVRRIVESEVFITRPSLSTIKNRLVRDGVKKLVSASDSNNMPMTPEKFTHAIVSAIIENKFSPLAMDDLMSTKIIVVPDGSWDNLRMSAEVRNILEYALKKINISKPRR